MELEGEVVSADAWLSAPFAFDLRPGADMRWRFSRDWTGSVLEMLEDGDPILRWEGAAAFDDGDPPEIRLERVVTPLPDDCLWPGFVTVRQGA